MDGARLKGDSPIFVDTKTGTVPRDRRAFRHHAAGHIGRPSGRRPRPLANRADQPGSGPGQLDDPQCGHAEQGNLPKRPPPNGRAARALTAAINAVPMAKTKAAWKHNAWAEVGVMGVGSFARGSAVPIASTPRG